MYKDLIFNSRLTLLKHRLLQRTLSKKNTSKKGSSKASEKNGLRVSNISFDFNQRRQHLIDIRIEQRILCPIEVNDLYVQHVFNNRCFHWTTALLIRRVFL